MIVNFNPFNHMVGTEVAPKGSKVLQKAIDTAKKTTAQYTKHDKPVGLVEKTVDRTSHNFIKPWQIIG